MALADRRVEPDTRTTFEKWLDALSAKNRATVTAWLTDPEVSISKIIEWVRDDDAEDEFVGIRVSKDTIGKWRRDHEVTR